VRDVLEVRGRATEPGYGSMTVVVRMNVPVSDDTPTWIELRKEGGQESLGPDVSSDGVE
jgi:hypothetical protein